jgi:hypothetical protein
MITFSIIDSPDQKLSVFLENRRVTLRLRYNLTMTRWAMDVAIDGVMKLQGKRLVGGVNLIGAHPSIELDGALFVAGNRPPDYDALINGDVRLYYATKGEIDAQVAA